MHKLLPIVCLLVAATTAFSQTTPDFDIGTKPYGSYQGGDIDTVNLGSGSVSLHIPVVSYPQRGDLDLSFYLSLNIGRTLWWHQISITGPNVVDEVKLTTIPSLKLTWNGRWAPGPFYVVYQQGTCAQPNPSFYDLNSLNTEVDNDQAAFGPDSGTSMGDLIGMVDGPQTQAPPDPDCDPGQGGNVDAAWDPDGGMHQFASTGSIGGPEESLDAAGLRYNPSTSVVTDRKGIQYLTDGGSMVDRNGNRITYNASRGSFFDSMGRTIDLTSVALTSIPSGCPSGTTSASTWTVPAYGGNSATETFTFCSETATITLPFNCSTQNMDGYHFEFENATPSVTLVRGMILPNGQSWQFNYDSAGALTQITLPTGGTIAYSWAGEEFNCVLDYPNSFSPAAPNPFYITSRTVDPKNGDPPSVWQYNLSGSVGGGGTGYVIDPQGNTTVYQFVGSPNSSNYVTSAAYYQNTSTGSVLLKTVATQYQMAENPQDLSSTYNVVATQITTTIPGVGSAVDTRTPDSGTMIYPNVTALGYAPPYPLTLGNIVSQTTTAFGGSTILQGGASSFLWQTSPAYFAANLLDLPQSVKTLDGTGNDCEETDYTYDDSAHFISLDPGNSFVGHGAAPNSVRGNLSATSKIASNSPCASTTLSGTSLTSQTFISDLGTIEESIDPKNNLTSFTHDSSTHTYVTGTTNALGQSVSGAYDFNTGLLTSMKDLNQQPSTYTYDVLHRLVCVELPDGGSTHFLINDAALTVDKITRLNGGNACVTNSGNIDMQYQFDPLGRQIETRLLSDPDGTTFTDTTYDSLGRVATTSNPYRTTADPTYGVTSYAYDVLNRKTIQTNADNTAQYPSTEQWCYDGLQIAGQANCVGHLGSTSQPGEWVDETDEDGHHWQRTSDSLGRLVEVVEDASNSQPETDYQYDALGNLRQVDQWGGAYGNAGDVQRRFTYDSLSRLLTAYNPESGTSTYTYPVGGSICAGNLSAPCTKTDARSVTTSFTYDQLNRVTAKTYSTNANGTPSSCYQFDKPISSASDPAPVGHLTLEWTLPGSCQVGTQSTVPVSALTARAILSHDVMGRVKSEQQCTPLNCAIATQFAVGYKYDYAGNQTQYSNGLSSTPGAGSGPLTFTSVFSGAGRLESMVSSWTTLPTSNMFSAQSGSSSQCNTAGTSPSYSPFGALMNAILGSGLTTSRSYDKRARTSCELDTGSVPSN